MEPLKVGVIPNNVTHLKFGYYFNQPLIKGVIPDSVTNLSFGYYFSQILNKDILPNNIKELTIYKKYKKINLYDFDKNILVSIIDNNTNKIEFLGIDISMNYGDHFKFIEFYYKINNKENCIGNIIFEELVQKVFHPDRIKKICDKYYIELSDFDEIY